jgi:hypothetical protein
LQFLENEDAMHNSKRRAKYHGVEVMPFSAVKESELEQGIKVL